MVDRVHVLVGRFGGLAEAHVYTEPALGGFEVERGDTTTLRYLGAHPCRLG